MANIDDKGILRPGQRKMRGSRLVEDVLKTVNLPRGWNYLYLALGDVMTGRIGTVDAEVEVKKPAASGRGR
jgi:hypothetical protein